jgi:ABC-type phosphate/phosphonate transport system substrate-binding protein
MDGRRVFVGSLVALLALMGRAAAGDEIMLVYPGKPGTAAEAKNVLDAFSQYVEQHTGWPRGYIKASYWNDEKPALANLQLQGKPAFGILSLAVYLKWKKQGVHMTVLAQSELDHKATMQFHLLVPEESKIESLEGAKGANVASSYLEDREFATNIVFAGKLDATKDIAVIDTLSIASAALPSCARFKPLDDGRRVDALLVDDDQLEGMKGMRLYAKMRVAWSSAPLPTPPVVTFDETHAADAQALLRVLTSMNGNTPGRKVLEDMTATGFRSPTAGAYAALAASY